MRRVIVSGNGASWYAANAMWHAALLGGQALEVVSVPAGLLASGALRWREGDFLLAVSSSGSMRDLVELARDPALPRPFGLITAAPRSALRDASGASAMISLTAQRAVSHTQAYLGGVVAALDVLALVTGDLQLAGALRRLPDLLQAQLGDAPAWAEESAAGLEPTWPRSAVVFGSGPAWAAAQEAALLLKEVARIPAEGTETREGATSAMYALNAEDIVLALPVAGDALAGEAGEVCARRGARLLGAPWSEEADPRVAAVVHFVYPLALAIELALAGETNPDQPDWYSDYEATARNRTGSAPAKSPLLRQTGGSA